MTYNNLTIKELALQQEEIYNKEYWNWMKENPGKIMHGASSKADVMKKVSFCETLKELEAFETCYTISGKSMQGIPNGFNFGVSAIKELIELYKK